MTTSDVLCEIVIRLTGDGGVSVQVHRGEKAAEAFKVIPQQLEPEKSTAEPEKKPEKKPEKNPEKRTDKTWQERMEEEGSPITKLGAAYFGSGTQERLRRVASIIAYAKPPHPEGFSTEDLVAMSNKGLEPTSTLRMSCVDVRNKIYLLKNLGLLEVNRTSKVPRYTYKAPMPRVSIHEENRAKALSEILAIWANSKTIKKIRKDSGRMSRDTLIRFVATETNYNIREGADLLRSANAVTGRGDSYKVCV